MAETGSTNADLARSARAGSARPWSVLVAEHQSAGRGRLGRAWTTSPGATLTFSALVPVPAAPGWVPLLTGLALADAIEELYAVRPYLKWPNDLLARVVEPEDDPDGVPGAEPSAEPVEPDGVPDAEPVEPDGGPSAEPVEPGGVPDAEPVEPGGVPDAELVEPDGVPDAEPVEPGSVPDAEPGGVLGRKLAGILCELTPVGIVVGIGLNVDQVDAELPVPTAGSLRQLAGAHPPGLTRERLLLRILAHLARVLEEWGRDPDAVREAYRSSCATLGRQVRVDLGARGIHRANAEAIDDDGRLVASWGGEVHALSAGDVTHVR